MIKPIEIEIKPYRRRVFVFLGYPHQQVQQWVKKNHNCDLGNQDNANGTLYTLENKDEIFYLLWVEKISNKPKDIFVVAHEALHLIFSILPSRDVPLTKQTEEAYIYLFEQLMNDIFNQWQQLHRKR